MLLKPFLVVQVCQKAAALAQPLGRHIARRVERRHPEAWCRGIIQICADAQGTIRCPQVTPCKVARLHIAREILNPHVGRDIAGRRTQLGHYRSIVGRVGLRV